MAAALPHENPRILDPRQRSNVSQSPAECIVVDSEVDVDDEVIIVSVEGPAATRKSPAIGQRPKSSEVIVISDSDSDSDVVIMSQEEEEVKRRRRWRNHVSISSPPSHRETKLPLVPSSLARQPLRSSSPASDSSPAGSPLHQPNPSATQPCLTHRLQRFSPSPHDSRLSLSSRSPSLTPQRSSSRDQTPPLRPSPLSSPLSRASSSSRPSPSPHSPLLHVPSHPSVRPSPSPSHTTAQRTAHTPPLQSAHHRLSPPSHSPTLPPSKCISRTSSASVQHQSDPVSKYPLTSVRTTPVIQNHRCRVKEEHSNQRARCGGHSSQADTRPLMGVKLEPPQYRDFLGSSSVSDQLLKRLRQTEKLASSRRDVTVDVKVRVASALFPHCPRELRLSPGEVSPSPTSTSGTRRQYQGCTDDDERPHSFSAHNRHHHTEAPLPKPGSYFDRSWSEGSHPSPSSLGRHQGRRGKSTTSSSLHGLKRHWRSSEDSSPVSPRKRQQQSLSEGLQPTGSVVRRRLEMSDDDNLGDQSVQGGVSRSSELALFCPVRTSPPNSLRRPSTPPNLQSPLQVAIASRSLDGCPSVKATDSKMRVVCQSYQDQNQTEPLSSQERRQEQRFKSEVSEDDHQQDYSNRKRHRHCSEDSSSTSMHGKKRHRCNSEHGQTSGSSDRSFSLDDLLQERSQAADNLLSCPTPAGNSPSPGQLPPFPPHPSTRTSLPPTSPGSPGGSLIGSQLRVSESRRDMDRSEGLSPPRPPGKMHVRAPESDFNSHGRTDCCRQDSTGESSSHLQHKPNCHRHHTAKFSPTSVRRKCRHSSSGRWKSHSSPSRQLEIPDFYSPYSETKGELVREPHRSPPPKTSRTVRPDLPPPCPSPTLGQPSVSQAHHSPDVFSPPVTPPPSPSGRVFSPPTACEDHPQKVHHTPPASASYTNTLPSDTTMSSPSIPLSSVPSRVRSKPMPKSPPVTAVKSRATSLPSPSLSPSDSSHPLPSSPAPLNSSLPSSSAVKLSSPSLQHKATLSSALTVSSPKGKPRDRYEGTFPLASPRRVNVLEQAFDLRGRSDSHYQDSCPLPKSKSKSKRHRRHTDEPSPTLLPKNKRRHSTSDDQQSHPRPCQKWKKSNFILHSNKSHRESAQKFSQASQQKSRHSSKLLQSSISPGHNSSGAISPVVIPAHLSTVHESSTPNVPGSHSQQISHTPPTPVSNTHPLPSVTSPSSTTFPSPASFRVQTNCAPKSPALTSQPPFSPTPCDPSHLSPLSPDPSALKLSPLPEGSSLILLSGTCTPKTDLPSLTTSPEANLTPSATKVSSKGKVPPKKKGKSLRLTKSPGSPRFTDARCKGISLLSQGALKLEPMDVPQQKKPKESPSLTTKQERNSLSSQEGDPATTGTSLWDLCSDISSSSFSSSPLVDDPPKSKQSSSQGDSLSCSSSSLSGEVSPPASRSSPASSGVSRIFPFGNTVRKECKQAALDLSSSAPVLPCTPSTPTTLSKSSSPPVSPPTITQSPSSPPASPPTFTASPSLTTTPPTVTPSPSPSAPPPTFTSSFPSTPPPTITPSPSLPPTITPSPSLPPTITPSPFPSTPPPTTRPSLSTPSLSSRRELTHEEAVLFDQAASEPPDTGPNSPRTCAPVQIGLPFCVAASPLLSTEPFPRNYGGHLYNYATGLERSAESVQNYLQLMDQLVSHGCYIPSSEIKKYALRTFKLSRESDVWWMHRILQLDLSIRSDVAVKGEFIWSVLETCIERLQLTPATSTAEATPRSLPSTTRLSSKVVLSYLFGLMAKDFNLRVSEYEGSLVERVLSLSRKWSNVRKLLSLLFASLEEKEEGGSSGGLLDLVEEVSSAICLPLLTCRHLDRSDLTTKLAREISRQLSEVSTVEKQQRLILALPSDYLRERVIALHLETTCIRTASFCNGGTTTYDQLELSLDRIGSAHLTRSPYTLSGERVDLGFFLFLQCHLLGSHLRCARGGPVVGFLETGSSPLPSEWRSYLETASEDEIQAKLLSLGPQVISLMDRLMQDECLLGEVTMPQCWGYLQLLQSLTG